MGLREWIVDPFGVKALVEESRLDRLANREQTLMILQTTQAQTEAASRMVGVLERVFQGIETDGLPPEGRTGFAEEFEAELDEKLHGSTES